LTPVPLVAVLATYIPGTPGARNRELIGRGGPLTLAPVTSHNVV
jgi:hypothetical protein